MNSNNNNNNNNSNNQQPRRRQYDALDCGGTFASLRLGFFIGEQKAKQSAETSKKKIEEEHRMAASFPL